MNSLHVVHIEDETIELISEIEMLLDNSEEVYIIKKRLARFQEQYPTRWNNIRIRLLSDIKQKFDI